MHNLIISNTTFEPKMSHKKTKQPIQSRSLEHSSHLTRLAQWLKHLPAEERYLQIRLTNPAIAGWLRNRYTVSREDEPKHKEDHDLCSKKLRHSIKNLFDNLILTSQKHYMDTVGLDYALVQDVDRFLELLSSLAARCRSVDGFGQPPNIGSQLPVSCNREELSFLLAEFFLKALHQRFQQEDSAKIDFQKEKLRKRQYGAFWVALSLEQKQKLLLLGSQDSDSLAERHNLDISIKDLQKQIRQLMKLQRNQFCNRLLKCRLKRCNDPIRPYHQLLFQTIHNKLDHKERIIKKKSKRRIFKSFSSNDTYETEREVVDCIIEKVAELATFKIETDIGNFVDILSKKANAYFSHRKIAFTRVQHVLQPYGVSLFLFGSCANGIALEKSDVDIAVSGNILAFFPYGTIRQKTAFAIQSINNLFVQRKWVVSAKPITTAAIPVLKLQINTGIPMQQPLHPSYLAELELTKQDLPNIIISVDITVDTRGLVQAEHCHLGITSTQLVGQWLAQTQSLYHVLMVLKHFLYRRNLSNTYKGGISTYCLFVMIKTYMRYADAKDPTPSALLEGFLKFIGMEFDEKIFGMDFKGQSSPLYDRQMTEYKVEVRDPLSGRIMTKNAFLYNKLKDEFLEMRGRCMDDLRLKIRHHLKNLSHQELQQTIEMTAEKYFSTYSEQYPKNVFNEYDSSF